MRQYNIPNTPHILRYHDLPGDKPPILFVHGLGCAGSFDYPEVAAQPVLAAHRRILVDLLGSGFSDKPADFSYEVKDHAEYLSGFMHALDIKKLILFGHSLGGAVALTLAWQGPERIERIILSESNLDAGVGTTSRAIAGYSLEAFTGRGFARLADASRRQGNDMWAASFSLCSPAAMYRVSASAVEGFRPSWREMLYAFPGPKTFIFGQLSLPDADVEELPRHGVHVEIVPDAGHSMAWENPAGLAEAIQKGMTHD